MRKSILKIVKSTLLIVLLKNLEAKIKWHFFNGEWKNAIMFTKFLSFFFYCEKMSHSFLF